MMLLVNPEFIESEAPQDVSPEALVKPSRGPAFRTAPMTSEEPQTPAEPGKEHPVWQAVLRS
jgi:hypothetical protein